MIKKLRTRLLKNITICINRSPLSLTMLVLLFNLMRIIFRITLIEEIKRPRDSMIMRLNSNLLPKDLLLKKPNAKLGKINTRKTLNREIAKSPSSRKFKLF